MTVTALKWEDLDRLRHIASAYVDVWTSRGPLVLQGDVEVAYFKGRDADELAALTAAQHNTYIELVNTLQMLGRKHKDAEATAAGLATRIQEITHGKE